MIEPNDQWNGSPEGSHQDMVRVSRRQMLRGGAALGVGVVASGTLLHVRVDAQGTPAASGEATAATGVIAQVAAAGTTFLATLTDEEQSAVLFDFSNMEQRQRWSNLPEGGFERAGLMWGNMSDAAKDAWLALMQTTLSEQGYTRVLAEWAADDALAAGSGGGGAPTDGGTPGGNGGPPDSNGTPPAGGGPGGDAGNGGPGGGGGGGLQYGMQYYWVAVIGEPSESDPWQWQWGGHHVTINATVGGDNIALTPSFIGVQPATYTDANGNTVRPLGDIDDTAFELVNALSDDQKQVAILGSEYIDLVLGPGQDGKTLQPEGLLVSELDDEQQALLVQLIGYYTGLVNDEFAAGRLAEVTDVLDQTYFVWYGPTEQGSASYFRVAGPTIVIEYSPQSMGGDAADHIHGIYRDPSNDYGVRYIG